MNNRNRFIKLLTISANKQELLLYGFSVFTEQLPRPWKKKQGKRKLNVTSGILSPEEAEAFEQHLVSEGGFFLEELAISTPGITPREPVLSYGADWKAPVPVAQLSCVHEFWNIQKEELVQQLQAVLGSQGKALYRDIQTLLAQLREECGVDFSQHGDRLGNYEHYDSVPLSCPLEIRYDESSEGKRVLVDKPAGWTRSLVVNCSAQQKERVLFNPIRLLEPENGQAEFLAKETVGLYTVYAWDQETGELVFFQSFSLCNQIILDISLNGTNQIIRDPWTESLSSNARNRSDIIHKQIETVQRHSSHHPICIGGMDPITVASQTGEQLLSLYRPRRCKGGFYSQKPERWGDRQLFKNSGVS